MIDWKWLLLVIGSLIAYFGKRLVERKREHEDAELAIKQLERERLEIAVQRESLEIGAELPKHADLDLEHDPGTPDMRAFVQLLINQNVYYTHMSCGQWEKLIAYRIGDDTTIGSVVLEWTQLDLLVALQMLKELDLKLTMENEEALPYAEQLRANPPGRRIAAFIDQRERVGEFTKPEAEAMRRSLKYSLEHSGLVDQAPLNAPNSRRI